MWRPGGWGAYGIPFGLLVGPRTATGCTCRARWRVERAYLERLRCCPCGGQQGAHFLLSPLLTLSAFPRFAWPTLRPVARGPPNRFSPLAALAPCARPLPAASSPSGAGG